jgi:hypothetical protein
LADPDVTRLAARTQPDLTCAYTAVWRPFSLLLSLQAQKTHDITKVGKLWPSKYRLIIEN